MRARRAFPSSAPALYEKSAKRLGCAFFDAGPVSELNRVDCLHLTRKGCRSLAAALAEIIPGLCG